MNENDEVRALKDLLIECLPYITDAIDDPTNCADGKRKTQGLHKRMRSAIEEKKE